MRTATPADVDALAALEHEAFGPDAWSVATLASEVGRDDRIVLVETTVDGSAPTGYVDVGVVAEIADLHRVAVATSARRHGTATALLDAALALAVGRGAERVLLEVAADNDPALGLYRREGFAEIARRRGYYAGRRDAVVMQRVLAEAPS